jgi:hypothetical protein
MSLKKLAVTFGLIVVAVSPVPAQSAGRDNLAGAPAAGPEARYCLRVEPVTGTLVERVRCWTREQWDEQGVDVDKEWAKEGVGVIE